MKTMKKLVSLCIAALLVLACLTVSVSAAAGDAVSAKSKDGVAFRFALIGDSHVNANGQHKEYFEQALKTLNTVGGVDALGLNGDVVLFSTSLSNTPYEIINGLLDTYGYGKDEGEIPYAYAMGNHEFMQNDNNTETAAQAVSIFETQMQQPLDYHMEVNGYHVIASGGESYSCQWSAGNYNTDEAWIMSEIEAIEASEDYNPNHPIFLMLHHPIIGTVLNGISNIDRRYTTDFVDFLAARPNIVQLTAHQHAAAQYPQTISQDAGFTAFQTPLTATSGGGTQHQTSFIDVTTDNKVMIYKIDMTSQTYIGEPWVIDLTKGAEGFQYTTEARSKYTAAPVNAEGATVEATDLANYSATISYPVGTVDTAGDNMVRRHMVTVTDKETGDVLVSQYYGADFTTVPQPETVSVTLNNLDAGTTYTVTATPESMYGVKGEPITGEFTTTGEKANITVAEPVAIKFDKSKVGDVTETDDGAGNITTTTSYSSVSSSGVLLRQGKYFTYPIVVGEGGDLEEAGLYRVTHRYGAQRAVTVSTSVKYEGDTAFTVADTATVLPAGANYNINNEYTEDDYITLKKGTNLLKIAVTSLSNNDGAYFILPKLSKVVSGAFVNYPIGTHIYDAINKVDGTGTGSITTNVSTATYQKSSMITFRKGNYIVFPISVPYTAAYKMELTEKTTGSTVRATTFQMAISEESLDAAKALTTYNCSTGSQSLTSSWQIFTLSDSYVLEGGKTYYVKLAATAVGGNHIAQLSNLKLTDNGEYGSNAKLSGLSVSGDEEYLRGFDSDVTSYDIVAPMPENGMLTIGATTSIAGATITIGEESAKSSLTSQVEVQYGINEIPVQVDVLSVSGKNSATYTVNVVIADSHVSLGNTAANMYVDDSETPISINKLFNGTGVVANNGAGNAGFGVAYNSTATIVVDLGVAYDLSLFTWEKTNQGDAVAGITVYGANNEDFSDAELIGTTDGTAEAGSKVASVSSHKIMKTDLSGTKAYRYVKLEKPSGAAKTFYPVKMDFYGTPAIKKAENELAVSVTVPSSEYVVGDTVIAAVYSGKELVDVDTVTAPSAYEVTLNVTKLTDTDTVKIMVWKNLRNAIPRDISQILK